MPLKLNVGLSRKVGEANYGSRGASLNVEIELESGLISEPDKLKDRIRQLFTSLRSSLAEELNGKPTLAANPSNGHPDANGHQNGNGRPTDNGDAKTPVRPATQSQIKAIYAIARSQRLDLGPFLRERFNQERPDDLNIEEASEAIDDLKRKE